MKSLKMFVPERAELAAEFVNEYCQSILGKTTTPHVLYRPEIHEIVKDHAEKLKYWRSEDYEWLYDADCIYFWPDGEITMDGKDFSSPDITFEEISPFDFLKLTPGDVEVWNNPEGDYNIGNLLTPTPALTEVIKRDLAKDKPTTTDRNEKAWEILNSIIKGGYIEKGISFKKVVSEAFEYADEFIKQAGNK